MIHDVKPGQGEAYFGSAILITFLLQGPEGWKFRGRGSHIWSICFMYRIRLLKITLHRTSFTQILVWWKSMRIEVHEASQISKSNLPFFKTRKAPWCDISYLNTPLQIHEGRIEEGFAHRNYIDNQTRDGFRLNNRIHDKGKQSTWIIDKFRCLKEYENQTTWTRNRFHCGIQNEFQTNRRSRKSSIYRSTDSFLSV
jgi:hypothetical protein